jgi:hypothetical protein
MAPQKVCGYLRLRLSIIVLVTGHNIGFHNTIASNGQYFHRFLQSYERKKEKLNDEIFCALFSQAAD